MLETNPSPASHIVIDEWQVWNVGCCVQFRTAFILLKGQSCIWIILVYALISDEFCQKLKNGFSAQQIGFLRVAHIMAHTKQFTIVESEAIECYLISGLFIWFLTSFSSSFPLFWWIPYELFWINKSHWSFSFWQFSKNSCKNWSIRCKEGSAAAGVLMRSAKPSSLAKRSWGGCLGKCQGIHFSLDLFGWNCGALTLEVKEVINKDAANGQAWPALPTGHWWFLCSCYQAQGSRGGPASMRGS